MSIVDPKNFVSAGFVLAITALLLMGAGACGGASGQEEEEEASSPDWDAVGEAIGKSGERMEGDVYRVNMPRGDLSVTSEGVDIKPGFALGSYAAFRSAGDGAALMLGDLVLTEDEYNDVISRLQ